MTLRYAILGLLTYAPMNGYYLKKIFDTSINHFWSANLSQIYRELGALEHKGFVRSKVLPQDDRPDKRIYCITDEGKKAFAGWLEEFPETSVTPKRDEFMVRIFFGSKLDKEKLIGQFQKFIDEREKGKLYIEALQNESKTYSGLKNADKKLSEFEKSLKERCDDFSFEKEMPYWSFTLKRAVYTSDASIKWAKECIRELEKQP